MEGVGGGDDHSFLRERGELLDTRRPLGVAACEIRIPLHDFGAAYPAPLRLRGPEVPEADQCVVAAPLVSSFDSRPLDPPERPLGRIITRRDAPASFLHFVGKRMEDADHDHAIGAASRQPCTAAAT